MRTFLILLGWLILLFVIVSNYVNLPLQDLLSGAFLIL